MSSRPSVAGHQTNHSKYLLEFEKPIAKMEQEIQRLESSQVESGRDYSDIIDSIRDQLNAALREAYGNLTPWENVLVARHPRRPLMRDYIRMLGSDFCELHGDRQCADDKAVVCGFVRLAGQRVMLIGHHKGRDTREKIEANFGCAHPDGYRKALRAMKLAEKFHVPVVSLIDTPGAYPGVESEERGIACAIAVNLMEMSRLRTPIVACVIGEGGSGGALGLAVADQVAVMQHAYYSVISPEGCAAILWKSGEQAPQAASALRLTPEDLKRLELVDAIVAEPLGGAHRDPEGTAKNLETWVARTLRDLKRLKVDTILRRRYDRLRHIGSFFEPATAEKPTKAGKPRQRRRQTAVAEVTAAQS
ncbi:MAG: acetyl-CoA carboxylase carboxyltransferase subunit alpha [Planctomycetes bacterium]|nr:acetyl-CoA carboxylase carboxyltransferase subunit alpha [Planctomycetota bacterium]